MPPTPRHAAHRDRSSIPVVVGAWKTTPDCGFRTPDQGLRDAPIAVRSPESAVVSVSPGVPVLPRIRPCHIATRQLDDRLAAAKWITARTAHIVPHRAERRPNALRYRRFDCDLGPLHVAEARRIDRLLHVHPEDEEIEQQL